MTQKLLGTFKKLIRVERDDYWLWALLQGRQKAGG